MRHEESLFTGFHIKSENEFSLLVGCAVLLAKISDLQGSRIDFACEGTFSNLTSVLLHLYLSL